ncbi:PH domain-containing protein [Pedobacter sp. CCM 8938]|uniref:PH domain-containing protein n=2 Tax=Pedobacter fastidiosus TaxID=2765361 RepID=A0ABR7KTX6_9SPHI|nr:PH domain-containing protein [Pedobacter fastidiosus]MBC6111496.1 PH domain-containing protein [Pedobacter fastidiosus]
MNSDFSKPQRQSAYGIIVMGAHTTFKLIKATIFLFVLAFVKMQSTYFVYLILGIVAITLISFLFAYLWYLKFTFFLDKEKQEFIVNKGIFSRDQVTIQLDKIQQVNINQNILQKIIGVYGLKIDTAGAHGDEVSIKAIDETSAYNLKEHLLSRANILAEKPEFVVNNAISEETPFLKISAGTLFKVGLTSNYGQSLALLAAFFYTVIYEGRQLLDAFEVDKNQIQNTVKGMVTLVSVAILVVALLIVLLVINLVRTFYKYFELEISRHQHSLLISSGLIAKKNTLVSPNKVQITKYSQNYFQKKMNMLNMSLRQAHFGKNKKGHEMQGNTLEIPGCNPLERDELLKMILGKVPPIGKTFIPDWRFLNLPIFFKMVLPVIIFLILAFNIPQIKPYIFITGVYLCIGILMIYISYRRHRLTVNQEFIIKKSGIWDLSNEIVAPSKIQAITTFQYPWHKGVDVGHLSLHTAAGQIHFKYGNYTEIKQLVNYWLYQIESGNEDWM